jgi:hypothetical protein
MDPNFHPSPADRLRHLLLQVAVAAISYASSSAARGTDRNPGFIALVNLVGNVVDRSKSRAQN